MNSTSPRPLLGLYLGLFITVALTCLEFRHLIRYVHVDPTAWSTSNHPGCTPITADFTEMHCPLPGLGSMYLFCDSVMCIRHDPTLGQITAEERETLHINSVRIAGILRERAAQQQKTVAR